MSLTYAIGDIHGCLAKLCSLMLRCEKHADGRPLGFVFVGDYIDRGPQSCGVIDCLIDLKAQHGERVVTLLGNHEAMALAAIDGSGPAGLWLLLAGQQPLIDGKAVPLLSPAQRVSVPESWIANQHRGASDRLGTEQAIK